MPLTDLPSFRQHLSSSTRILAVLGAGLSAASGLPTFRGAGGLWRNFDAISLATPEAFDANPFLVWEFYNYRRHMALAARPNAGHFALAELGRRVAGFVTVSQNVDGLSPRAGHTNNLHLLHGSLFNIKCTKCNYTRQHDLTDPIFPALTDPSLQSSSFPSASNPQIPSPTPAQLASIPRCPSCPSGLLRPGVVWFGESLPAETMKSVGSWITAGPIDLCIVVGTSSTVWPAAGYAEMARRQGARIAVVNLDRETVELNGLEDDDWWFCDDAAVVLPEMVKGLGGEVSD